MKMNPFIYSDDNKRYHTYNYYLKHRYGSKVAKVSLNGNFTCPNRDGTKGYGGCIFCSNSGSGEHGGSIYDSLDTQFEKMCAVASRKWPNCKYIPYFQANSNTYGSVTKIKSCIDAIKNKKNVVAIALATRPDCLENDVLEYLTKLNQEVDLWVELGLQTIHDSTAAFLNRGHSYQEFLGGLQKLRDRNINVCVHIINGLPHESIDMMMETIKEVGKLDIQAIKIHMLYVLKDTKLATIYQNHEFELLSREDYIQLVAQQLTYLPKEIIIERLTGDGKVEDLIAPHWSIKKTTILNDIDKYMVQHDLYQGMHVK